MFLRSLLERTKDATYTSLLRWKALAERIRAGVQTEIQVPGQWIAPREGPITVAKATLTIGTPLPDTWLLAPKSAISTRMFAEPN